MPKIIYNEGRVVGLSAYELYVKQHYAVDPNKEPATEREWLASTLALGTSMLLKVQPGDKDISNKSLNDSTKTEKTVSVIDYPLPSTSKLCAASTIIGSYFYGEGHVATNSHFATKITSYGELIKNDSNGSPNATSTKGSDVPTGISTDWPKNMKNQMNGYLSIIDGVVIQPGTWSAAKNTPPQKDLVPNMAGVPTVRLQIKGKIETAFFVLLVGFTNRVVVTGESGIQSGSTNSPSPQDGDFIGPAVFPWGSKIIFTTPNAAINVFMKNKYQRKLPSTASSSKIASGMSIIDMEDYDPQTGYSNGYLKPIAGKTSVPVNLYVEDFATWGNSASILTAYSRDTNYPAVLYGAKIDSTGNKKMCPLDVAAPGTVKMFESGATETEMKKYESTYPGTTALRHNSDGTISIIHNDSIYRSSPKVSVAITKDSNDSKAPYIAETTVEPQNPNDSSITIKAISLQDTTRELLNTSGDDGSVDIQLKSPGGSITNESVTYSGSFNWTDLLDMLANNKKANLSMTINKIDSSNPSSGDISDVFYKMIGDKSVVFGTGYRSYTYRRNSDGTYKYTHLSDKLDYVYLKPWKSNLDTSNSDGYFKVDLKLYPSDFSSSSKFEMIIKAYLKSDKPYSVPEGSGQCLTKRFYILWRGSISSGMKEAAIPLFYKSDDSIGYQGRSSSAIIYTWDSVPDDGSESNMIKFLISGRSILANSANFLWAPNVTIQGSGKAGDNNDVIRVVDRSFSYDDEKPDQLDVIMITSPNKNNYNTSIEFDKGVSTESTDSPSFTFTISGVYTQ